MLKEWSSIVAALESGEQCVLLRKGGILDTPSGFHIQSRRFWLYPTWEHQSIQNIRDAFRHHLEQARPVEGTNTISSYAEVVGEADVDSDDIIQNLESFHIWSREYVDTRRRWQPQRPLKAILLKVFKSQPVTIPVLDEYAGCRSWLEAEQEINGGVPVLGDNQISDIVGQFRSMTS